MNILFIEYPKCSTCKKAKSWLIENKIEFMDRNIVEEVPTYDELKKWIALSGKPINKFFNTSGILYRQMEVSKKLLNMTDDEKIQFLSSNGMLIKRPILVLEKNVLIGFKEKEWQDLFLIEKDR
ncbi:MAG: arsenate reductase family protein [Clostridia bacterium]